MAAFFVPCFPLSRLAGESWREGGARPHAFMTILSPTFVGEG